MEKQAFILVDRNDNYVACSTQPNISKPHYYIIREEDGLTYQAMSDIKNCSGDRIGTIYKEKVEDRDEPSSNGTS